jgi:hypothetical protein
MNEKDILKTNIFKAKKVVILSPNVDEVRGSQFKDKIITLDN